MSTWTDLYARLPWVTRLDKTQPCDAHKYGHMPISDPGLFAKYACKNRARWQFAALRDTGMDGEDGVYCWPHLICATRQMAEQDRTQAALAALRQETESAGDRS
jgi:hypothetical protein